MSESNGQTGQDDGSQQVVQPWIDYWVKMVEQNSEWSQAMMAGTPENVDPSAVRRHWLDAMSQSIEGYMRTPTFLESMKRNSDAMAAAKTTSELAKLEAARQAGIPHIEDISGLYDRLETANELVLKRLESIESQLEAITKKLAEKPKKQSGKKN